jgi:hexosaminidase
VGRIKKERDMNLPETSISKRTGTLGRMIFFACACIFFIGQAAPQKASPGGPCIIPRPAKLEVGAGSFQIGPKTSIVFDSRSSDVPEVAEYLAARLGPPTGFSLAVRSAVGNVPEDAILLRTGDVLSKLGAEGYQLSVSKKGIKIEAASPAGLFYGVQTLLQLLPAEVEGPGKAEGVPWKVPFVKIEDRPRFVWRGAHLDVGRHFFPKEFVKKYIDLLAKYKMNTFHWHLTEDQGWRIEIPKYPRLTEVGAWRRESLHDGIPHGGFYTQDDIREVVAYAKKRFITIVPEIEMPGHSLAALAAYPELSCSGGPFEVCTEWGVFNDVYCPGNEKTFEFLEDVLTEVIGLFPGEFIHVGGDEVPKVRWQNCVKCQARIKAEGLKGEDELQSYFIKRIEAFLSAKGKRLIGWDEILEGGLAPNATVMSWRGIEGGIEAAKSGHDVVMSPTSHCYFDYYQGLFDEPWAIGGFLPIDKVYAYEPLPAELPAEQAKHILGAQANVWTEYLSESSQVEYMLLPRLLALSEVVWSPKDLRGFADFSRRIIPHYDRLAEAALNFRLPPPDGLGGKKLISGPTQVPIYPPFPGAEVRFSTDGTDPTGASPLLTGAPLEIKDSAAVKARTVLRGGRMSRVISTSFSRIDPERNGLDYAYYEGSWLRLPNLEGLTPLKTGHVFDISFEPAGQREDNFALLFKGFLEIKTPGDYWFSMVVDDGALLVIDGKEVVRHDGLFWILEPGGKIHLEAGRHPVQIAYFQKSGDRRLDIFCEGPGLEKRLLFPHWLFRN